MFKKLLAVLLMVPVMAFGAWEPTKNVEVIVGNVPGSGNEIGFRKLADIVNKQLQKKVVWIVVNKPGADSVVMMNQMMIEPADGHTIAVPSHMSTFLTNDIWQKDVKKFEWDSFSDIISLGRSPLVLIATKNSVVNTPAEFVQYIKNTKKPISVAIGGGAHRMAFEAIMNQTKADRTLIKPINFQGPAQVMASVAGDVGMEFGILPIFVAKPLVDSGKIKAIGFSGPRKMVQMPNVPLLSDAIPGVTSMAGWAMVLPPNTPKEIVEWYVKTFTAAVKSKEYKDWTYENLIYVDESELTPDGFRKNMRDLRKSFEPVMKTMKLDD